MDETSSIQWARTSETGVTSIKAVRFTGGPRKTEITRFTGPKPSHVPHTADPKRLIQCEAVDKGHGLWYSACTRTMAAACYACYVTRRGTRRRQDSYVTPRWWHAQRRGKSRCLVSVYSRSDNGCWVCLQRAHRRRRRRDNGVMLDVERIMNGERCMCRQLVKCHKLQMPDKLI